MPVSPARSAAFDILLRVERKASYASELLHSEAYASLSAPDHALATELVMGVLRWRSRLDEEIAAASSQPMSKLDLEILIALRLALYQFRWLDRIPQRAALHESVELVKRARKRSAASFVNAVLRKAQAGKKEKAEPSTSAADLAHINAHPLWLVERWINEYGYEAARAICEHDQTVPPTTIRLRNSAVEADLRREGIVLASGSLLAGARRVVAGEVTRTQAFLAGEAVIQDEASQLVSALVGHAVEGRRGMRASVLDCCAAPGGKTLAIADHNPEASITAVDLHPHRARLLKRMVRGGLSQSRIRMVAADAARLPSLTHFDRVLADVPCSGTGTLARNPEIKWRLAASDLGDLQTRQMAILQSAMERVAAGGRIVYSTCSMEREENEDVVDRVMAEDGSFRLVDCNAELDALRAKSELTWPESAPPLTRGVYLRTIPGIHPCDGFFAAVLEKL